ncbi:tetratricopeptide repeat-containing sensor histidine kinase [Nonlabens xiamenensis]|uniref:tetratricopeptide repeat-containing sensor histidine kinase n=1 Tax=Nonlabens xiamenensis TaxID=2341043 RepID=UPI000F61544B|nr:sensor histidine kinase [Nonlabens xiamenensis]
MKISLSLFYKFVYLIVTILTQTVQTQDRAQDSTFLVAQLDKAMQATQQGTYKESQIIYDRIEDNILLMENYDLTVKYLGDQGILKFYKGDFKGAYDLFEKAYQQAVKANQDKDQMRYLNNMGAAMTYLGDLEGGLEVHEISAELATRLKDTLQLAKSYNNLGLIYDEMKQPERALGFYEKSASLKSQLGLEAEALTTRINMAGVRFEIASQSADTTSVRKLEPELKSISKTAKYLQLGKIQLQALNNLSLVKKYLGQQDTAMHFYQQLYDMGRDQSDLEVERVAALNLGINYFQQGQEDLATQYLMIAEPLIENNGMASERMRLNKYLSKIYNERGSQDKAYSYLENYVALKDSISNANLQEKIANLEIRYKTAEQQKKILKQQNSLVENKLELEKRNRIISWVLMGLVLLTLGTLFLWRQSRYKQQRLRQEKQLAVAQAEVDNQKRLRDQRSRISRDLHDNIGSQLTYLISSLDNLKFRQSTADSPAAMTITNLSKFTRQTISELRDTIWAMNKERIDLQEIADRTSALAGQLTVAMGGELQITVDSLLQSPLPIFSNINGMHLYRIIQEAINNAVKHAGAATIEIRIANKEKQLNIQVTDDGNGFDKEQVQAGNGLSNMQKRAEEMGATLDIQSKPDKGSQVNLRYDHDQHETSKKIAQ